MLSVIIPSYNRARFLEGAIHSVLEQSVACDELIVVDDGSSDNTPKLVRCLAEGTDIPLRYLSQENQGAAAARNRGIAAAHGDMLCFLDSDDRFEADKIEVQLRAMEKNPFSLISHTREIWYRRGKRLNQKKKHQPPHGNIFSRCLEMCVVGMSTVMARRELFERYGLFDSKLPCCEDYDLWLRVIAHEEFLLIDKPLTLKNGGREDQLSVQYQTGMDRYRIKAISNLLERGGLSACQRQQAIAELRRKCTVYGNGCIKHNKKEEGGYYLQLPLRYEDRS